MIVRSWQLNLWHEDGDPTSHKIVYAMLPRDSVGSFLVIIIAFAAILALSCWNL